MKTSLRILLLAQLTLSITSYNAMADDDDTSYSSSSSSSSRSSSDQLVRPGLELEAKATGGVNVGGAKGETKVAPKIVGEAKIEPYIAVGGETVEVKFKAGASVSGQGTTEDVKPLDARTKNDGAFGVHAALAVEGKDGIAKVEGKVGHTWTAETGQRSSLGVIAGLCSPPGRDGDKFQLCGNLGLGRKFYEADKGTELSGEVLIQRQSKDGSRIFGGARIAHERLDSKVPDTYFAGVTIGANFDVNAGAVRASRER